MEITIPEEKLPGLQFQMDEANRRLKQVRREEFATLEAYVTAQVIADADSGLNQLVMQAAQQVASIAVGSASTITPEALVAAVSAYSTADDQTRLTVREALGIV